MRPNYDPIAEQRYRKINAPYKRTSNGKFITDEFSIPEFEEYLHKPWDWYEKVDGMNMRIRSTEEGIKYGGKTDRAVIPGGLKDYMESMIEANRVFLSLLRPGTVLYGEGFGGKIQKGGAYGEQRFILFDIRYPEGDWAAPVLVQAVGARLGCGSVEFLGTATLAEAIDVARQGTTKSFLRDGLVEGAVGMPLGFPNDRRGNPIITKVTHRDFLATT